GLRARVSDFGLAKQVNPLTFLATSAGTLTFKPPEAFADAKGDSCAGDVWAIGATFYLLLTDRLPVDLPPNFNWGSKHLFDKPIIPPSQINPDVNEGLDRIVRRSLEKTVDERYPTASELLDALENWRLRTPELSQTSEMLSQEPPKSVLGSPSPADEKHVQDLVRRAFEARRSGRLTEAADVMEEAFNKSPGLREKYAHQVKMWRCGVSM
ncbi:MAG: serine/threonine protein kinase, partial [Verrucomicrobia bacterium]|nr:serine/threonine protein kinase [Verrucomicrobiota bacterium]